MHTGIPAYGHAGEKSQVHMGAQARRLVATQALGHTSVDRHAHTGVHTGVCTHAEDAKGLARED
eukprot:9030864-Alexandrium_andersonii.AAC.1